MYVDDLLLICEGQQMVGSSAATDYSEATINLSGVVGDPGSGAPLYMIVVVTTAFASSGSTATVTFQVRDEADVDVLDSGSTIIVQTDAIIVTTLTEGKVLCIPLPAGLITQQYLGLSCLYGGETVTAGNIDAFIGLHAVLNP